MLTPAVLLHSQQSYSPVPLPQHSKPPVPRLIPQAFHRNQNALEGGILNKFNS